MQFPWLWFLEVLILTAVNIPVARSSEIECVARGDYVNCSSAHLTYIPHDLPLGILGLDVSHNHLNLLQWTLPYTNLKSLIICRSSVDRVLFRTFSRLVSLELLDLSYNNIKFLSHLDSNLTFLQTPQLLQLSLKGNPLKSLGLDPIRSDSLRRLDLTDCDIRHLEGDSSLKWMRNLISLVLDGNPLLKVDQLVSESLEELYLVGTQLRYIKPEIYFQLPRLRILDVSKNLYLAGLSRTGRAESKSLQILRAEFCSLVSLEIRGLPALRHLYLKGNKIDSIRRGDLISNERLTVVDLSMNWIQIVDPVGFTGAHSLSWMDLSSNKIEDLGYSIEPLSRLVFLNVSGNPLASIASVEAAPVLTILDASHCELNSLSPGLFHLEQLESVNLSRNSIQSLPTGMTSFTLRELDLRYNRLTTVEDSWFKHFPRLQAIRLEGNRLTEPFHPDIISRLGHVDWHLADNPWMCNCGDGRFKNFYHHLSAKGSSHVPTCLGPEQVKGVSWKDACFSIEAEATTKHPKKNAWLPMLIAALATMGIIILLYLIKRKSGNREISERPADTSQTQRTVTTTIFTEPVRVESHLPSYEEAVLMPKPPSKSSKSHADTQTTVSFIGSSHSLHSKTKNNLIHSPSSNSL